MRTLKLIAVLILLPLFLGLFGVWELQRSTESIKEFADIKAELSEMHVEIEAMVAKPFSRSAKVDINGERMGVHEALSRVTQAEHELTIVQPVAGVMNNLAKGAIALGLLASLVGVLGLLGLRWAAPRESFP